VTGRPPGAASRRRAFYMIEWRTLMNRQKLNPETLSVESFETAPAAAAEFAGPTQRCETRLTICTIGPEF
jgi:hypothetical protein